MLFFKNMLCIKQDTVLNQKGGVKISSSHFIISTADMFSHHCTTWFSAQLKTQMNELPKY